MVEALSILFVFELTLFVLVDYYKFNTIYTPALCLGAPFAIVLLVAVFVGPYFDFLPLSEASVILWCIGLLLFWLPGAVLMFAVLEGKIAFPFENIVSSDGINTVIRIISWLFIIILLLSSVRSYLIHGTIAGESFSKDFASQGFAAHCLSMMKYNVAYLVAVNSGKKIQSYIITILTFVFLFLYNVKGGIILTALVCLFARFIMLRSKLNFLKIISIIILGSMFFVLSYVIALGEFSFNFILFHFLAYILAGIVGLSEHLKQGLPVDVDFLIIFQPVINLFHVVTGGDVSRAISELWVDTNLIYAKQSNVKTFFGSIYVYSGGVKGMLVSLTAGLLSYYLLVITIVKKKLTYLILYLFVVASLMLGWFDFYFNNLFFYEVVVYVFIVSLMSLFLSSICIKKNKCSNGSCIFLQKKINNI